MKISLMKILGYSLFKRHKKMIRFIVIENTAIFIAMLIYSLVTVRTGTGVCILVSAVTALTEFIIVVLNITSVEKTGVQKSLKGGCL